MFKVSMSVGMACWSYLALVVVVAENSLQFIGGSLGDSSLDIMQGERIIVTLVKLPKRRPERRLQMGIR